MSKTNTATISHGEITVTVTVVHHILKFQVPNGRTCEQT